MKRLLLFCLGVIYVAAIAAAGTPGSRRPVEFTLALSGGELAPMSFTLAPRPGKPATFSSLAGSGLIEDPINTAVGIGALASNRGGYSNTAIGVNSLSSNIDGRRNTAVGESALESNTYNGHNTAIGYLALTRLQGGSHNTAIGAGAGEFLENGFCNIYVGQGVPGWANDSHTIRIGSPYDETPEGGNWVGQNQCYIAGIVETPFIAANNPAVMGITSEGRLGTMSAALLPPGPAGPPGPVGPGLVSGSLLFLQSGYAPPSGYTLLGSTDIALMANKKSTKITVNVYQKQ